MIHDYRNIVSIKLNWWFKNEITAAADDCKDAPTFNP